MTVSNLQREHTCNKFRRLMNGGVYTCDRCGGLHEREFSLLCCSCEAEVEETPACECPRCGEIELVVTGEFIDNAGRPFAESECGNCGHIET